MSNFNIKDSNSHVEANISGKGLFFCFALYGKALCMGLIVNSVMCKWGTLELTINHLLDAQPKLELLMLNTVLPICKVYLDVLQASFWNGSFFILMNSGLGNWLFTMALFSLYTILTETVVLNWRYEVLLFGLWCQQLPAAVLIISWLF